MRRPHRYGTLYGMVARDLVERLHGSYRDPFHGVVMASPRLLVEAAEEIERLRSQAEANSTGTSASHA